MIKVAVRKAQHFVCSAGRRKLCPVQSAQAVKARRVGLGICCCTRISTRSLQGGNPCMLQRLHAQQTHLWLRHSLRMYLHSDRPSDTRPEMAMPMWSSILNTLRSEEDSSDDERFRVATTTQVLLCMHAGRC